MAEVRWSLAHFIGTFTITTHSEFKLGKYNILIVDDHPIVRKGLRDLIEQEPDLKVGGEAACVSEALQQVEATHPDMAIIDISLAGENGIELIEQIKAGYPEIQMLVSSVHDEKVFAGRVLRAGAMGYISKRESIRKIIDAIRQVLRGDIYLSPHMTNTLLHRAVVGESLNHEPVETLSNRELEVFELIGEGLETNQIARKLKVSHKTIESHRKNIMRKLNLPNSTQLNRHAFKWSQQDQ
jgi:DNA-binding NarL/FixJ family response regulator